MPGTFQGFHSDYQSVVDDKGRIKIPSALLPGIEEHLPWVTTSLDGEVIRIYPLAEWEKAKNDLRAMGEDGEKIIFFAESHMVSDYGLDKGGRMLLPNLPCRDRLRAVRLVWVREHIEILSEEQYQTRLRRCSDTDR